MAPLWRRPSVIPARAESSNLQPLERYNSLSLAGQNLMLFQKYNIQCPHEDFITNFIEIRVDPVVWYGDCWPIPNDGIHIFGAWFSFMWQLAKWHIIFLKHPLKILWTFVFLRIFCYIPLIFMWTKFYWTGPILQGPVPHLMGPVPSYSIRLDQSQLGYFHE